MPSYDGKPIALLHLATHTSGLPRMPKNSWVGVVDWKNPSADYTLKLLYEFLSKVKLNHEPGSAYKYSNLGAGLLGHVLALKEGKSYEDLVTERICRPLGMHDTRITLTSSMRTRLARPYTKYGEPGHNWDVRTLEGAGALRSTTSDMLHFLAANMGLVETDLHDAMAASHIERRRISERVSVGLGWHVSTIEEHEEPVIWHNGQTGGYYAFVGFMKRRAGVVLLANTAHELDPAGAQILKLLAKR